MPKVETGDILKFLQDVWAVGNRITMDAYSLANLVLDVASVVNFVALLLMLRAVVKNRKVLRGYSIVGSFLTFSSIVGFEIAYYLLGNTIGFALGWATVAFWFIAFLFSLRQKINGTPPDPSSVANSSATE